MQYLLLRKNNPGFVFILMSLNRVIRVVGGTVGHMQKYHKLYSYSVMGSGRWGGRHTHVIS